MGKRYKEQRRRMWLRDPHCRECGVRTVLPEDIAHRLGRPAGRLQQLPGALRDVMATVDHAYCRLDPRRAEGGKRRLLCWRCNNDRGARDEASVPIEELWRRSGCYRRLAEG